MIGLDTNVLLRLFLDDDSSQTERARLFVKTATLSEKVAIGPIVLSEFAWTLRRQFKLKKTAVIELLGEVFSTDDLEILHRGSAERALVAYQGGRADFPDYLIAFVNLEFGCASTATFDVAALDHIAFSSVP